jgi:hypothetical protein
MNNKRWWTFCVFLEDIGSCFDCYGAQRNKVNDRTLALGAPRDCLPYGSDAFFPTLCAFSDAAVLVTGRPDFEDWSMGRCAWFLVRLREPLAVELPT